MPHEEIKIELITAETIQEMKFCKENFRKLQELNIVQTEQISSMNKNIEGFQEIKRNLSIEIGKLKSLSEYLKAIITLRDEKIKILKKKIQYLKLKKTIEKKLKN